VSTIDATIAKFDTKFSSLKEYHHNRGNSLKNSGVPTDVQKEINEAISLLNSVNPKLDELGQINPKKANEVVKELNGRVQEVNEFSALRKSLSSSASHPSHSHSPSPASSSASPSPAPSSPLLVEVDSIFGEFDKHFETVQPGDILA
jgi:hypothetical protein